MSHPMIYPCTDEYLKPGTTWTSTSQARLAWIFQMPKSGTLKKIGFRIAGLTTGASVTISVETVSESTGYPTGTLYKANASGSISITTSNKTYFCEINSTTGVSCTSGDIVAVVCSPASGFNGQIVSGMNNGSTFPYVCTGTSGAWNTYVNNSPSITLDIDDTYVVPPFCRVPFDQQPNQDWGNNDAPDHRGCRFSLPFQDASVVGFVFLILSSEDYTVALYDDDDQTILASKVIDKDIQFSSAQAKWYCWMLPSPQILTKDTFYRLSFLPSSTTHLNLGAYSITKDGSLNPLSGLPGGINCYLTTCSGTPTGPSSWTDTDNVRILCQILIETGTGRKSNPKNRVSIQSGDWSDPNIWSDDLGVESDGTIPFNNCNITIQSGHTVVLDADTSSFPNGINGIVIEEDGIFTVDPTVRTYLKLKNHITGNGQMIWGTDDDPVLCLEDGNPVTSTICFNGDYRIKVPLSMVGEVRDLYGEVKENREGTDDYITINPQDWDITIREGDEILIENSSPYDPEDAGDTGYQPALLRTVDSVEDINSTTRKINLTRILDDKDPDIDPWVDAVLVEAGNGIGIKSGTIKVQSISTGWVYTYSTCYHFYDMTTTHSAPYFKGVWFYAWVHSIVEWEHYYLEISNNFVPEFIGCVIDWGGTALIGIPGRFRDCLIHGVGYLACNTGEYIPLDLSERPYIDNCVFFNGTDRGCGTALDWADGWDVTNCKFFNDCEYGGGPEGYNNMGFSYVAGVVKNCVFKNIDIRNMYYAFYDCSDCVFQNIKVKNSGGKATVFQVTNCLIDGLNLDDIGWARSSVFWMGGNNVIKNTNFDPVADQFDAEDSQQWPVFSEIGSPFWLIDCSGSYVYPDLIMTQKRVKNGLNPYIQAYNWNNKGEYAVFTSGHSAVRDTSFYPIGKTYSYKISNIVEYLPLTRSGDDSRQPAFFQIPVRLEPGDQIDITAQLYKTTTWAVTAPRLQLIDPVHDPLHDELLEYEALDEEVMPDTNNEWVELELSYTATKSMKAFIRVMGEHNLDTDMWVHIEYIKS